MNTDEVVISEPGGAYATRVPVVGCQCSWELSNIGSLSCFARIEDLRAAGLGGDLKGMWVEWADPIVGRWGGVVSERPLADGVAEISAEGWAALLRDRVLGEWDQPPEGAPAGIARKAFMAAINVTGVPSYLTFGAFDEAGETINVTLGGEDLLQDVLPKLHDDGGLEWVVDADRVLHCAARLGRDRSASVRFTEGREVVTYKKADSTFSSTPTQTMEIESLQDASHRGQSGASQLHTTGRWRHPAITVTPTVTGSTPDTIPMQMTIANVGNAWARCDLGDQVRLVIESAGFSGTFRVTERGFDAAARELSLAGEATPDA